MLIISAVNETGHVYTSGIYLHGQLEDLYETSKVQLINPFDEGIIVNPATQFVVRPTKEGIFPCICDDFECILYMWNEPISFDKDSLEGLIVLKDDHALAIQDCERSFTGKQFDVRFLPDYRRSY